MPIQFFSVVIMKDIGKHFNDKPVGKWSKRAKMQGFMSTSHFLFPNSFFTLNPLKLKGGQVIEKKSFQSSHKNVFSYWAVMTLLLGQQEKGEEEDEVSAEEEDEASIEEEDEASIEEEDEASAEEEDEASIEEEDEASIEEEDEASAEEEDEASIEEEDEASTEEEDEASAE